MIETDLRHAAEWLDARIVGDAAHRFIGVQTDSRSECEDRLFVALRGEHFDGHDFAAAARARGAAALMVEHELDIDAPQLVVDSSLAALGALAWHWRELMQPRVIAITGSNGKTTVKEMTRRILSRCRAPHQVLATRGNLNNHIGVPLTLLELSPTHRYAVVEMGANHRHEIEKLVAIADPDIVLVNNARSAHMEGFGSLQGVIRAKGEMYECARPDAIAVYNDDEDAVDYWRAIAAPEQSLDFSIRHDADITGGYRQHPDGLGIRYTDGIEDGAFLLAMQGEHNVYNALAAVTLAVAAGVPLIDAGRALEGFSGVSGRQQILPGLNRSRLIDDSYNANPDSVAAALRVLHAQGGERWLALGDMAELGDRAEELHRQTIELAKRLGVQEFYAYGEHACRAADVFGKQGFCFSDKALMAEFLAQRLHPDVTLLIKGSRSAGMDELVEALRADPRHPGGKHAV